MSASVKQTIIPLSASARRRQRRQRSKQAVKAKEEPQQAPIYTWELKFEYNMRPGTLHVRARTEEEARDVAHEKWNAEMDKEWNKRHGCTLGQSYVHDNTFPYVAKVVDLVAHEYSALEMIERKEEEGVDVRAIVAKNDRLDYNDRDFSQLRGVGSPAYRTNVGNPDLYNFRSFFTMSDLIAKGEFKKVEADLILTLALDG